MERIVGTVVRGLRAPIVKNGDDLRKIVVDTVMQAAENGEFVIRDRDILAVTESIVARAQNNYCSVDDIAEDVRTKLGGETIGIVFPITSRNRFSIVLRGFAKGAKKVVVQLSYPSDEVGNHIVSEDMLEEKGVVGPPNGSKPRDVLVDAMELEALKAFEANDELNPAD